MLCICVVSLACVEVCERSAEMSVEVHGCVCVMEVSWGKGVSVVWRYMWIYLHIHLYMCIKCMHGYKSIYVQGAL